MRNWVLIGSGLLVAVLAKGCPNTAEHSTKLSDKQSLPALNSSKESYSSKQYLPPLLPLPQIPSISQLPSQYPQGSSSTPIASKQPNVSERSDLVSSPSSTAPPRDKEGLHPVDQAREPEINSSNVQARVSDERNSQALPNQEPVQDEEVSDLESSKLEEHLRLESENQPEVVSENSTNTESTRDTYTPSSERDVTSQNEILSQPAVSSNSQSGSGRCNFPWDLDSAGNRCGDRAASERPNLNINSLISSYSNPIQRYSSPPANYGSTYVRGYFRKNGTYVRGHFRRRR